MERPANRIILGDNLEVLPSLADEAFQMVDRTPFIGPPDLTPANWATMDDDRYCIDILTQISAIQAALDKVALGRSTTTPIRVSSAPSQTSRPSAPSS